MSSKTKIVVLHMKEIIYTGIFLVFLIILGVLVFFMFGPGKFKETAADTSDVYTPGIYRTSIELGGNSFDMEVSVDTQKVRSIRLSNLSETTAAMFPLMEPALDELETQILNGASLDELEYSSDQKYTSLMLIRAIHDALAKAEIQ